MWEHLLSCLTIQVKCLWHILVLMSNIKTCPCIAIQRANEGNGSADAMLCASMSYIHYEYSGAPLLPLAGKV